MFEFMPPPKKVTYRDTKEYNIVEIQELYQLAESESDHEWETWDSGSLSDIVGNSNILLTILCYSRNGEEETHWTSSYLCSYI